MTRYVVQWRPNANHAFEWDSCLTHDDDMGDQGAGWDLPTARALLRREAEHDLEINYTRRGGDAVDYSHPITAAVLIATLRIDELEPSREVRAGNYRYRIMPVDAAGETT